MSFGRRVVAGDSLPAWFAFGLYAALVWVATAGVSALVLLCRNAYHPITVSLLATAATAGAWPFRPRPDPERPPAHGSPAHGAAVAALAIVLVFLAFAAAAHSEHLLTDRDPSVYINTGRAIARTHRIHPVVASSPFDDTRAFTLKSAGFAVARNHLFANFFQFLPALLALGWAVGGDTGLLLVPALLGALALLALYALATSVVGPRWALLGPALLAVGPLQSWFSRDAYAELPLELLALGGLWVFIESRNEGGAVLGAIAGAILGSIIFVRIDALAILVAMPIVFAIEHLRAATLESRARRRRRRAGLSSFAITLVVMLIAGSAVAHKLSQGYLDDLSHDLTLLEVAFGAGIAAAIGIFMVHRACAGLGHRVAQNRALVWAGGALTIGIALYAYILRPQSGDAPRFALHPGDPVVSRKVVDAFYYSSSFRWFAWYLGIFTLVLAVVGFIALGVRAVRSDSGALVLLAAALPVTLLYIARPSIAPDHLWAMRRYLPVVLPAMTIAASAAAIWVSAAIGDWRPRLRAPFVVAAIVAMVVPAAAAGLPLLGAQIQGGALQAVLSVCNATGDNAAIAIEPYALLGTELPQTIRGFCGVPAAGIKAGVNVELATYARQWKDAGRQLYVVTAARRPVRDSAPDAIQIAHLVIRDAREPNRTLGHRPDGYAPRPVDLWLYRVDPA
jgi:hypothetical protein